MAVISITISEAALQKVAGIPATIALSANIPSTIFYTIDGTTPTTDSSIYLSPLALPTDEGTVVLSIFATDGVDSSAIITKSYGTTIVGDRLPRDKISGLSNSQSRSTYPFAGNWVDSTRRQYENTGGITVDAPDLTQIPDGYDGFGQISNYTNLPLDEYSFHFSETNNIGQMGHGIGNLPAETVVIPAANPAIGGSPSTNSPFFNAKSLVIFDDSREQPFDPESSVVNRPYFSLEDVTTARYGKQLFTSALDGSGPRGNALRQQFNPRDNTITYYYYDSDTNRWIISKVPYVQKNPDMFNYSKILFGRDTGTVGRVFMWIPFAHKTLT